MTDQFRFICLDPKKAKRKAIQNTLSQLGSITWLKTAPFAFPRYPEARARAEIAYEAARKKQSNTYYKRTKIMLLMAQYSGSRAFFEKNKNAIAVAWNGLNGTRRVFMDGARDAGARQLYFELSPFSGRITVDPCGVNFSNSLPVPSRMIT